MPEAIAWLGDFIVDWLIVPALWLVLERLAICSAVGLTAGLFVGFLTTTE